MSSSFNISSLFDMPDDTSHLRQENPTDGLHVRVFGVEGLPMTVKCKDVIEDVRAQLEELAPYTKITEAFNDIMMTKPLPTHTIIFDMDPPVLFNTMLFILGDALDREFERAYLSKFDHPMNIVTARMIDVARRPPAPGGMA